MIAVDSSAHGASRIDQRGSRPPSTSQASVISHRYRARLHSSPPRFLWLMVRPKRFVFRTRKVPSPHIHLLHRSGGSKLDQPNLEMTILFWSWRRDCGSIFHSAVVPSVLSYPDRSAGFDHDLTQSTEPDLDWRRSGEFQTTSFELASFLWESSPVPALFDRGRS